MAPPNIIIRMMNRTINVHKMLNTLLLPLSDCDWYFAVVHAAIVPSEHLSLKEIKFSR